MIAASLSSARSGARRAAGYPDPADSDRPRTPVARAIDAASRGRYFEAIRILEDEARLVGGAEKLPGRALTTYAVAMVETNPKRTQPAVELCRHALTREFVDPDLFADLGHVYLVAGLRRRAVEAIDRGLRIDPDHTRLVALRKKLGVRRRPPIAFLERSHPLNRLLGQLLHPRGGPRRAS